MTIAKYYEDGRYVGDLRIFIPAGTSVDLPGLKLDAGDRNFEVIIRPRDDIPTREAKK